MSTTDLRYATNSSTRTTTGFVRRGRGMGVPTANGILTLPYDRPMSKIRKTSRGKLHVKKKEELVWNFSEAGVFSVGAEEQLSATRVIHPQKKRKFPRSDGIGHRRGNPLAGQDDPLRFTFAGKYADSRPSGILKDDQMIHSRWAPRDGRREQNEKDQS